MGWAAAPADDAEELVVGDGAGLAAGAAADAGWGVEDGLAESVGAGWPTAAAAAVRFAALLAVVLGVGVGLALDEPLAASSRVVLD